MLSFLKSAKTSSKRTVRHNSYFLGEIITKKGILNDATNNFNDAQDALKATEERWLQR